MGRLSSVAALSGLIASRGQRCHPSQEQAIQEPTSAALCFTGPRQLLGKAPMIQENMRTRRQTIALTELVEIVQTDLTLPMRTLFPPRMADLRAMKEIAHMPVRKLGTLGDSNI
ncbi:hypothetical protein NDU88_007758 [Pleurodeles waltl]|uniref:Uncharacterized protein n=1 Tax=Pleurodeles waltl TaxID=8319 RepID=A0AAV7VRC3_PLEWA|nr:hypothetical protein NDU88_007758 [Pleurodeles waltl]